MAFQHYIPYTTAKIDIEPPNAPKSIGTGFFYHTPLNDGSEYGITLLISNKHVFEDPQGKLIVTLNRKNENNKRAVDATPKFGDTLTFKMTGFDSLYFAHPDQEVDLACVNVSGITHTDAFYHFLFKEFLTPIDHNRVAVGSEVIFVGYPENRYDVVNNLPLIRKGSIASMPDIDFNGKGQIVIDAQIFPGSSGSPVFVEWGDKWSLLGVVSQTMIREAQLQTLPTNVQLGVQQILGLGIVIKQRHVQELIDHAVKEQIRRAPPGS